LSDYEREEAIRCQVDLMEKEIVYLKGTKRVRAKKAYYKLLKTCGKKCGLDEPIYLKRCE
jgi:hypothetical protein